MDNATTVQYAGLLHSLAAKTKTTVRDLDPSNELMFLRIRTNKHEIMVAPGENQPLLSLSILVAHNSPGLTFVVYIHLVNS